MFHADLHVKLTDTLSKAMCLLQKRHLQYTSKQPIIAKILTLFQESVNS